MKTIVCVCTCQRPQMLARLLHHVALLNDPGDLSVVVSDNDLGAEGLAVCNALPESYPFEVHAELVRTPGIVYARNAAMSKAIALGADFIAFLDDDEWPSPVWLSELHRIQRLHNSDAVGGPTLTDFPDNTPTDLIGLSYYGADMNLPDGAECELQAAGNFLVRASTAAQLAPQFYHPAFAHSCGEDLAFFTQLLDRGARMHWAAHAIVHEEVPGYRLSADWMKTRVITIANSRVRVMQMLRPSPRHALVRIIKTGGLFVVSMGLSVAGLSNKGLAEKGALLRWKFEGKLRAHLRTATTRKEPVEERLKTDS